MNSLTQAKREPPWFFRRLVCTPSGFSFSRDIETARHVFLHREIFGRKEAFVCLTRDRPEFRQYQIVIRTEQSELRFIRKNEVELKTYTKLNRPPFHNDVYLFFVVIPDGRGT